MTNPFKKVLGLIKTVAPTIATGLGGPLAGMATNMVIKAVTGDTKASAEEAENQLLAVSNPETILALKKAEQEFQAQLKQMDVDLEKIAEADRESAREREVQVRDKTPRNLAYLAVAAFWIFAAVGLLVYLKESLDAVKMAAVSGFIGTVLGYAISEVKQVFTYYFGSSAGSAAKTELLAKAND